MEESCENEKEEVVHPETTDREPKKPTLALPMPSDEVAGGISEICNNVAPKSNSEVDLDGGNLSLEGVVLDSVIRRPRSSSKKRNYRQTARGTDTASSGDEDEPKSASSRLDEELSTTNNVPDVEMNAGQKSIASTIREPVNETENVTAGPSSSNCITEPQNKRRNEADPPTASVGEEDDVSMSSSTQVVDVETETPSVPVRPREPLSSEDSSSSSEHLEAQRRFNTGGDEMDDSDMSSSSSSLEFMEDEDEDELEDDDTSESSDSLDDLDEMPAVTEPTPGRLAKQRLANKSKNQKDQSLPKVLLKPKAKCGWSGPKAIFQREMGYRTRAQAQGAEIFRSKFYGSLFSAERLELAKKLDGHDGCVNCLNFNYAGTKLASGSDDLEIKIWNYGVGKLLTSFNSKHRSNVFQAKFMPLVGLDNIIVSCARDSTVRLTELDSTGSVAASRKLAQHRGPVHKLAINPETPHIVLSCGEDGVVMSCDIREDKSQKILSLVENGRKLSLYSIHSNPLISHEFCVSGRDEYVRVYDSRKMSRTSSNPSANGEEVHVGTESENDDPPVKRYCPHHLQGHPSKPHITAAVYNYNGTEIIASYNDENIYLFDTSHSDLADSVNCYEGHLNSATVKGVNFFGDRSQFIVSGSDDSHVFIWDRKTESIVNFFRGDEKGVVNCLEPHPSAPILATSGLDDDIKIWIPSSETPPKMGELASTVKKNLRKRDEEVASRPNALDGQIMWSLINHLHREQRRNRRAAGEDNSDSSSDEDDDEVGNPSSRGIECVIA